MSEAKPAEAREDGAVASSTDPASQVANWQAQLLRACCIGGGVIHVLGPVGHRVFVGQWDSGAALLIAIGCVLLTLTATRIGSARMQSTAVVGLLAISVVDLASTSPWGPVTVTATCGLLTVAALLLGRVAVLAILVAKAAALFAASFVIELPPRWYDRAQHDPSVFANWLRITLLCLLVMAGVVYLLRRAASSAEASHATARRDLILANRKLLRSRRSREARLRAEQAMCAHQRVQAISQLSGGIAHVLNNALVVVRGALEDLRGDRAHPARHRASVSVTAATHIVADSLQALMVFSRRDETEPELVDVAEEVTSIVDGIGATLGSDILLRVQGAGGMTVEIEPSTLELLVVNLVLNARDALPNGGEVRISVVGGQTIELVVEDNGDGMTAETIARACDALFTSRDPARHAGLGLTVAVGIAEQAGGSLHLESRPGIGTRVVVRLPHAGALEATQTATASMPLLLHGEFSDIQTADPASVDGSDPPDALDGIHPDAWKSQITMRLARLTAVIAPSTLVVAAASPAALPLDLLAAMLGAWLLSAIAGWRGRLSQRARAVLLTVPVAAVGLLMIGRWSFLAAPPVVAVITSIAWITLLGPRWAGAIALGAVAAVALVIGAHYDAASPWPDVARFSPDTAEPWRRIASNLALVEFLLGFSVLAVFDSARRGINSMEVARGRVQAARAEEEREGARQLAVEREASRAARIGATGRVIGTIAHDINNALHGILTTASELDEISLRDHEVETVVDDLSDAYEHCANLASQFAVTEDAWPTRAAAIDVSTEVQRMARTLPLTLGTAIKLECEIASGCYARIVATDLRRVLFNLVTNARDAISGSGTIRISVEVIGDQVLLEVKDTGSGIDDETRGRVFEAFFTTKPEGKGTGLGLHSLSQIVERTEGRIEVETALGVGSTFRIQWPTAEPPSTKPLPLRDRPAVASSGSTVLVAEDDDMVRSAIVRLLEQGGYVVRAAADGNEALALVKEPGPCVALCIDGVMPGVPSTEVIDEFRRRHPGTPVIVCSGQLPTELARRGLSSELVTLLPKPFDPDQLRDLVAAGIRDQVRLEPIGRGRIALVVDDQAPVRGMIERQLAKFGFRVHAFESSESLLEYASALTPVPDLLVTDLHLAGMQGAELARALVQRWPSLRVLLVTGDIAVPATTSHAVLTKPFTSAQLHERVSRILGPESRERETA